MIVACLAVTVMFAACDKTNGDDDDDGGGGNGNGGYSIVISNLSASFNGQEVHLILFTKTIELRFFDKPEITGKAKVSEGKVTVVLTSVSDNKPWTPSPDQYYYAGFKVGGKTYVTKSRCGGSSNTNVNFTTDVREVVGNISGTVSLYNIPAGWVNMNIGVFDENDGGNFEGNWIDISQISGTSCTDIIWSIPIYVDNPLRVSANFTSCLHLYFDNEGWAYWSHILADDYYYPQASVIPYKYIDNLYKDVGSLGQWDISKYYSMPD